MTEPLSARGLSLEHVGKEELWDCNEHPQELYQHRAAYDAVTCGNESLDIKMKKTERNYEANGADTEHVGAVLIDDGHLSQHGMDDRAPGRNDDHQPDGRAKGTDKHCDVQEYQWHKPHDSHNDVIQRCKVVQDGIHGWKGSSGAY